MTLRDLRETLNQAPLGMLDQEIDFKIVDDRLVNRVEYIIPHNFEAGLGGDMVEWIFRLED